MPPVGYSYNHPKSSYRSASRHPWGSKGLSSRRPWHRRKSTCRGYRKLKLNLSPRSKLFQLRVPSLPSFANRDGRSTIKQSCSRIQVKPCWACAPGTWSAQCCTEKALKSWMKPQVLKGLGYSNTNYVSRGLGGRPRQEAGIQGKQNKCGHRAQGCSRSGCKILKMEELCVLYALCGNGQVLALISTERKLSPWASSC